MEEKGEKVQIYGKMILRTKNMEERITSKKRRDKVIEKEERTATEREKNLPAFALCEAS